MAERKLALPSVSVVGGVALIARHPCATPGPEPLLYRAGGADRFLYGFGRRPEHGGWFLRPAGSGLRRLLCDWGIHHRNPDVPPAFLFLAVPPLLCRERRRGRSDSRGADLRLRSDYLAIVTLGFGEIVQLLATNLAITGGATGIFGFLRSGWAGTQSLIWLAFIT